MTQQRPKISVMVLMGGYTSEFDISLKSGTVVCTELDTEKYDVYPCVITKNQFCTFTYLLTLEMKKN